MDPSLRRKIIAVAVAAPIITAFVMGGLVYRKWSEKGPRSGGTPAVARASDPLEEALFKLAAAGSLAPDDMDRAAGEAEKLASRPLVEACLARALAARKRRDAAAERAAIDKALALDPARPESQLAKALAAVEAWARAAAPQAKIHPPTTAISLPLTVPPSPGLEPGLDRLEGRAGRIVRLLAALRGGGKPEEVAPLWTEISAEGVDDRLAFAVGVHSLRQGSPDDAAPWLPWLRTAASSQPEDPARLRCAALAALLSGEGAEALQLIRRWNAADGGSKRAETLAWWAVAARKLGDVKEARARLDEASKLDPAWRGARGWLAYQLGDKAQALEDATALREADPWARYLRALLHWEANELDAAFAECGLLLQSWPDHFETLVLQARVLAARGQADKAEELWKHARKLGASRPEAKLGLAEFYAAGGRRDEAIQAFLEIPNDPYAHWRGAQLILEAGRHADALRWAELGAQRYPKDPRLWTILARAYHARLDHFNERSSLEQAAALAPEDADIQKLLAACVEEMKRE